MKKTGEVIKEYRNANNISAAELAEKVEVSQQFLAAIENGKRKLSNKVFDALKEIMPKGYIEEIQKYEDYSKTPEGVLSELDNLKKENAKLKSNLNIDAKDLKHPPKEKMIQVPVYDSVSAGAGTEPNASPIDYITLPENMAKDCVIINVHGDSMEPTIQNGAAIMLKKGIEVGNNEIGVFIVDDEAIVKRYKTSEGRCYLYSDNPAYLPREIRKGDSIEACGKVIWIMNRP